MLTAGLKSNPEIICYDSLLMGAPRKIERRFELYMHIQGKHRAKQLSDKTAT